MTVPTDKQIFQGEIADYWMENGILVSLSKSPKRTVENITNNVALVKSITNNKRVPLLIYLTNSPIPNKETRKFASEKLPEIYTAMAMISKPGLATLIMKVLFKFKAPPIPMRNFTDDKEARQWLKAYL
jgi:hypothetical protein